MNTVYGTIDGSFGLKIEYLEGYQPTPAQIAWITELYFKSMLETPVEERVEAIIANEEEKSWEEHDANLSSR